jgi:hypothetical protein
MNALQAFFMLITLAKYQDHLKARRAFNPVGKKD